MCVWWIFNLTVYQEKIKVDDTYIELYNLLVGKGVLN